MCTSKNSPCTRKYTHIEFFAIQSSLIRIQNQHSSLRNLGFMKSVTNVFYFTTKGQID